MQLPFQGLRRNTAEQGQMQVINLKLFADNGLTMRKARAGVSNIRSVGQIRPARRLPKV